MRSSDLVPLLAPRAPSGLGFRQGVVVSFNSDTGANVIDVGGTPLVDVPMLNSGEAVALKAGHVVALLTFMSSWWILGRVTLPNTAQFASASVAFDGARAATTGFDVTTTTQDVASATLTVPSWVDQAIVMATADCTGDNTSAQNDDAYFVSASINGAVSNSNMASVHLDRQVPASASMELLITDPGSTIPVAARMRTNIATWPGAGSNMRASITAIAIYRSTS